MSSRKRPDLIERPRYPNPLPLPPYAPKLLSIAAPASRYAHPSFAARLAATHALPLVVDADAGMPLDAALLAHAPSWGGPERHDTATRPLNMDEVDAEDRWLLSAELLDGPIAAPDPASAAAAALAATEVAQSSVVNTPHRSDNVTWLRRTEYLAGVELRKEAKKDARPVHDEIDSSREAQLGRIESTFAAIRKPLSTLRHPTKPGVHAVEAYDVLPDEQTWATPLSVWRFADPPGRVAGSKPLPDARLPAMFLRQYQGNNYCLYLNSVRDAAAVQMQQGSEALQAAEDAEAHKMLRRREAGWVGPGQDDEEFMITDEDGEKQTDPRWSSYYSVKRTYEPFDHGTTSQDVVLILTDEPSALASAEDGEPGDTDPAAQPEAPPHPNGILPRIAAEEAHWRLKGEKGKAPARRKVAYYHPLQFRGNMRVQRKAYKGLDDDNYFNEASIWARDVSRSEVAERLERRAEVDELRRDRPVWPPASAASEDFDADGTYAPEAMRRTRDRAAAERRRREEDRREKEEKREREALEEDEEGVPELRLKANGSAGKDKSAEPQSDADAAPAQPEADADADADADEGSADGSARASVAGASDDEEEEEDDVLEDGESIAADEELAALRAEAEGAGDDVPETEEGGRSRRSRRAPAASAADEGPAEEDDAPAPSPAPASTSAAPAAAEASADDDAMDD